MLCWAVAQSDRLIDVVGLLSVMSLSEQEQLGTRANVSFLLMSRGQILGMCSQWLSARCDLPVMDICSYTAAVCPYHVPSSFSDCAGSMGFSSDSVIHS